MKIPNSHPAVSCFVKGRFDEPELPDEYGKAHAVFYANIVNYSTQRRRTSA